MEEGWKVIIRDSNGKTIFTFPYSPNIPIPHKGSIVWMPDRPDKGNGYKVKDIHFGYDDKTVYIFTDA